MTENKLIQWLRQNRMQDVVQLSLAMHLRRGQILGLPFLVMVVEVFYRPKTRNGRKERVIAEFSDWDEVIPDLVNDLSRFALYTKTTYGNNGAHVYIHEWYGDVPEAKQPAAVRRNVIL